MQYAHISNESLEQQALFRWADFAMGIYPELEYMYHIPNEGKRSHATGARLKAEGLRAGVPDICLPTARGEYHGLYIEMKYGKNKPTPHQAGYLAFLESQGYKTAVCYSWEQAKDVIVNYLELKIAVDCMKGAVNET